MKNYMKKFFRLDIYLKDMVEMGRAYAADNARVDNVVPIVSPTQSTAEAIFTFTERKDV